MLLLVYTFYREVSKCFNVFYILISSLVYGHFWNAPGILEMFEVLNETMLELNMFTYERLQISNQRAMKAVFLHTYKIQHTLPLKRTLNSTNLPVYSY